MVSSSAKPLVAGLDDLHALTKRKNEQIGFCDLVWKWKGGDEKYSTTTSPWTILCYFKIAMTTRSFRLLWRRWHFIAAYYPPVTLAPNFFYITTSSCLKICKDIKGICKKRALIYWDFRALVLPILLCDYKWSDHPRLGAIQGISNEMIVPSHFHLYHFYTTQYYLHLWTTTTTTGMWQVLIPGWSFDGTRLMYKTG